LVASSRAVMGLRASVAASTALLAPSSCSRARARAAGTRSPPGQRPPQAAQPRQQLTVLDLHAAPQPGEHVGHHLARPLRHLASPQRAAPQPKTRSLEPDTAVQGLGLRHLTPLDHRDRRTPGDLHRLGPLVLGLELRRQPPRQRTQRRRLVHRLLGRPQLGQLLLDERPPPRRRRALIALHLWLRRRR
jgi:hypothetical protein